MSLIPKQSLFQDVRELCSSGWHDLPQTGTGAAGNYLEQILGMEITNHDGPDAGQWELKFSSGTAPLTLFHLTPQPRGCVKELIRRFGWIGKNGKPSFRHTIWGQSDKGFSVVYENETVWVKHPDMPDPAPHWAEDDLLNSVGSKLRRLLLVSGKTRKRDGVTQANYKTATALEQFRLSSLVNAIEDGLIAVDFDAYLQDTGATRDHGTKFRIKPENIGKLYGRSTKLY